MLAGLHLASAPQHAPPSLCRSLRPQQGAVPPLQRSQTHHPEAPILPSLQPLLRWSQAPPCRNGPPVGAASRQQARMRPPVQWAVSVDLADPVFKDSMSACAKLWLRYALIVG